MGSAPEIPKVHSPFSSALLLSTSLPIPSFASSYFRLHFQNLKGNTIIPLENQPSMICLVPMENPDPTSIINLETGRIPPKSFNMNLDWSQAFRSWPSVTPGWRNWLRRWPMFKEPTGSNMTLANVWTYLYPKWSETSRCSYRLLTFGLTPSKHSCSIMGQWHLLWWTLWCLLAWTYMLLIDPSIY